jgi:hypothetical protein
MTKDELSREQLELQAVVAYLTYGSYRKAGKAIFCSKSVVWERVDCFRKAHQAVLAPTASGHYSVLNFPQTSPTASPLS